MQNLRPFWQVRYGLSVNRDINFRSSRIFILPKFRKFVLDKLPSTYEDVSAIKALAWSEFGGQEEIRT